MNSFFYNLIQNYIFYEFFHKNCLNINILETPLSELKTYMGNLLIK